MNFRSNVQKDSEQNDIFSSLIYLIFEQYSSSYTNQKIRSFVKNNNVMEANQTDISLNNKQRKAS